MTKLEIVNETIRKTHICFVNETPESFAKRNTKSYIERWARSTIEWAAQTGKLEA